MRRKLLMVVRTAAATTGLTLVAASVPSRIVAEGEDGSKYRYWEDPYAGPYCGGPCPNSMCCNIVPTLRPFDPA